MPVGFFGKHGIAFRKNKALGYSFSVQVYTEKFAIKSIPISQNHLKVECFRQSHQERLMQ